VIVSENEMSAAIAYTLKNTYSARTITVPSVLSMLFALARVLFNGGSTDLADVSHTTLALLQTGLLACMLKDIWDRLCDNIPTFIQE
jgi:hypothetical protein